jgi:leucine dehydrogenase
MSNLSTSSLVVTEIPVEGYFKVLRFQNADVGLDAIISIHDMTLGPTLGGIRIHPYATFDAALNDVLRLSKGMTYKSALAECKWGGGKSVIIADPKSPNKAQLLEAYAEAINYLKGDYIGAEDVGCSPQDMAVLAKFTPYVVGLEYQGSSGNPSPFTAWGTFIGIQALLQKLYGSKDVSGRSVAIQGLGSVGSKLAEFLFWHGAKLYLSDIDESKAKTLAAHYSAEFVPCADILKVPCDVLAPCAMGGIINSETIPDLRCRAIGGCSNNQLLKETDGDELRRLGILYAPDFVINAGGLVNVTQELEPMGYDSGVSRAKVSKIYDQLTLIFDIAQQNNCSTNRAAISLAEYRIKYGIGKRLEPVQFPLAKN